MILIWLTLAVSLTLVGSASIFDNLPPIIIDDQMQANTKPDLHQFLFQPVGQYATDVHYMHVRMQIPFSPILESIENMESYMDSVKNQSVTHAHTVNIQKVIGFGKMRIKILKDNFMNLLLNLPNFSIVQRSKRQLMALFGLVGTAFGIANTIAIENISTKLAKEIHRTDMLVDVTQLHENHLHSIDTQLINAASVLQDMIHFNPAIVESAVSTMVHQTQDIFHKCSNVIAAAQMHRLSPLMFPHDVLTSVKLHIDTIAEKNKYISFINHNSDLYQIEVSFVFEPINNTFNVILHVPLVKQEYMLQLHQYIPFPLSQNFAQNHTLTPAVGEKDILAFGFMNTFKIISQSDLAGCHHMGEFYFCKGRNVLQTRMEETCLGAIFVKHLSGMKQHCKFEIKPLREQVFQLSRNKWQVYSQSTFSTTVVCPKSVRPISIDFTTTIELQPGCKIRLQSHLLYAEHEDEITVPGIHFHWAWNASALFPDVTQASFTAALNSLIDYGLHVVEAADIAHQLKFVNFTDNTPAAYTDMFSHPMHIVVIIISCLIICMILYVCYHCYMSAKRPQQSLPYPMPSAPTARHFELAQMPCQVSYSQ